MTEEKFFGGNNKTVIQESRTGNKEVGCSCLVFKRDKAVPFCRARPLAADDKSCTDGMLAMKYEFEIASFGEQGGVDR